METSFLNNKQHNISNTNPGMGMIGGAFSPKAVHMLESARIQCCLEFEELTNGSWCSFLLTTLYAIINLSSDVISKTDFEQLKFKFFYGSEWEELSLTWLSNVKTFLLLYEFTKYDTFSLRLFALNISNRNLGVHELYVKWGESKNRLSLTSGKSVILDCL